MRCQCCEQAPATIHIRDVEDWQVSDVLLICDACAQVVVPQFMMQGSELPSCKTVLGRAKEGIGKAQEVIEDSNDSELPEVEEEISPICTSCDLTFAEFQKAGRLGCPSCYEAFQEQIDPILDRIHGGNDIEHKGRSPGSPAETSRAACRQRIQKLTRQMEAAVDEENYEKAAELRDKISELETELKA